jgi:hypothetical protein
LPCAVTGCDGWIDPLGFALENFAAIGRWRHHEGDTPIDASATLPDGALIAGPAGLRRYLVAHRGEFVGVMLALSDSARSNYRWSPLILGIVRSAPLQARS